MTTEGRQESIRQVINAGCFAAYAFAIGPGHFPVIVSVLGCATLRLIAHLSWLHHRSKQTLASVERRAALIRAASGHPECERLVYRALRGHVSDADVVRIFGAVCELHDSTRRSLVTRKAESTVTAFINGTGGASRGQ